MRFFATTVFICGVVASGFNVASGQTPDGSTGTTASFQATPTVPHKIHFAGMTLAVREDARAEIQKDVDALTKSPRYFDVKAERARTYFPIIERIFAEERVPEDFKFLVLQESALISDAVSVSDAVGFWQFKDFTAREMGLRVDNEVDERMNIVSATRAAAKYIKQNNFMFNNWVYALQSYQMGAGGVRRIVGDDVNGSRHMEITADTYWYVKKYLAHKIAFQDAVETEPKLKVTEVVMAQGGSLDALSSSMSIDIAGLKEFNKWAKKGSFPSDKSYTVIVPSSSVGPEFSTLYLTTAKPAEPVQANQNKEATKTEKEVLINDIPVLQAKPGETLTALAARAGVPLGQFMKFNDLEDSHRAVSGGYYFTAKKKSKTDQDFHKVKSGETIWQISQQYGIQIKRLKKYNRLDEGASNLSAGTMVWLSSTKPKDGVVIDSDEPAVELEESKVFDWGSSNNSSKAADNEVVIMNEIISEPIAETSVTPSATDAVVHEVKTQETLYSVARQYGVTIKDLMDYNNKKDFSVSLGEKLKIPSK